MILSIESKAFHEVRYLNASRKGRAETARLPFYRAKASRLPVGCDALVVTSDLQGMASPGWQEAAALVGVAVARAVEELDLGRACVLLAGDLYSVPEANKRGGFGDVSSVWAEFGAFAAFVCGVAGNHDDVSRVETSAHVHLLDGDVVTFGEMRIGGVGLVVGDGAKRGRRDEDAQRAKLESALDADILVLHEGPFVDDTCEGSAVVRDVIADAHVPLVVCGHRAWRDPLVTLGATRILNVHERVVVAT